MSAPSAPDKHQVRSAGHASAWSGASGVVRALLGFATTVVLARLVAPEEFGIVAIVLVFSAVAMVLVDSGLGAALIQRQDIDRVDESTAFYFNLGVAVFVAGILVTAAPWIASFFAQPSLTAITRLMALSVVISALGAIHSTLLTKALDFRPLFFISVWAAVSSSMLAILLAWRGYGVWSLVWQVLAQTAVTTILLWTWHRWRPLPVFDLRALRRLLGFGGHVMVASLIDTLYTRLYSVFIGKVFGARELGIFMRAQETHQLPAGLLSNVANRVALPAFSKASAEPLVLAAMLVKASRLLMFVNLPVMLGIAVTAEPLVAVLFGKDWLSVAPLLQVLCIVGALWPLQVLNVSALLSQGRSRLVLRIEVLKKGIGVLLLVIASNFGLQEVAAGMAATAVVAFIINSSCSGRLLGLGTLEQLRAIGGTIAASSIMVVVVVLTQHYLLFSPLINLMVLIPVGGVVFLSVSTMFGGGQIREIVHQCRTGI